MNDEQRNKAWNDMPEWMRGEIISMYRSYWITNNTAKRMEEIFGRDNLNPQNEITITPTE